MKVVVVGAGAVGSYLAERLSTEGQDVIVVESDKTRAAEMQETLDALVIAGNGASRSVLKEAQVEDADLLIAVSNNDGANLLACHTAAELGVKRTVARVEDAGLREGISGLNVDVVIDPGETAAEEILALVQKGGVSDLIEFARGQLILVGGVIKPGSPLIDGPLRDLRSQLNEFDWIVAAIVRGGLTMVAHGDTEIRRDDHVLMMVESDQVDAATEMMGLRLRRIDRIVILGTTRLAELTAELVRSDGIDVVMVDPDVSRCRQMAERHPSVLTLIGDPTDPKVLGGLGLNSRDAVLALTGWDERNILGCLIAKALGASTTVSRVNRLELVPLLGDVNIDATVSSRLAAANAILRFVRRGRIYSVATFKDTDAEALEIEVEAGSEAVGESLRGLSLPRGAVIGGVLREGLAFVPTGDTVIQPRDHLIIFSVPSTIQHVEGLFTE